MRMRIRREDSWVGRAALQLLGGPAAVYRTSGAGVWHQGTRGAWWRLHGKSKFGLRLSAVEVERAEPLAFEREEGAREKRGRENVGHTCCFIQRRRRIVAHGVVFLF
jgi:hypothetical protein